MPIPLCSANLGALSARAAVPHYNRAALVPRLVHIGAGGFNRSHLAVYLDDLLEAGLARDWAECGAGLLARDEKLHTALASQDCLYCLLLRDAEQNSLRVIGSLSEHIYAPAAPHLLIERMSSPECRIVSMTVTEGGYFIDASGAFDENHPDIRFDLAHPETPRTFLGFLTEAAWRRMRKGSAAFTVMSCDNVQSNGEVARNALLSFAGMRHRELAKWIAGNVLFPNSMVDRITPVTTDAEIGYIESKYGVSDRCPVVCEPFRHWVIEDTFANGRPPWDLAGAQFTADVRPYEIIKMRLLNGGHSALAYIAVVLGHVYVCQAIEDTEIRELLQAFLEEVTPALPEASGMDLAQYKASIVHRFSNPTIRDQITRICSEGSAKIAKFIVPTVCDLIEAGRPVQMTAFAVAAWLYSLRGIDEQGRPTQIVDSAAALFADFLRSGCRDQKAALGVRPVFADLGASENTFQAGVRKHLASLHNRGAREALRLVLAERAACIEKDRCEY